MPESNYDDGYESDCERSECSCCPCAKYRFAGSVPPCEINTFYPFLYAGYATSYFPYAPYSYGYLSPVLLSLVVARNCARRVRNTDVNVVGYPWC